MELPKWIKDFLYTGPYLENSNRLADILAAIQVLGTYEFAARDIDKWANRLGREPRSAETWDDVFKQHPEFFTLDDSNKMALVWRRSFTRDYDTVTKSILSGDELDALKAEEKKPGAPPRISRKPLNQEQIEHLCNLAINLHEREIQHRQEKRWWITAIVAIVVAIISLLG
jgi:hypothetical protein